MLVYRGSGCLMPSPVVGGGMLCQSSQSSLCLYCMAYWGIAFAWWPHRACNCTPSLPTTVLAAGKPVAALQSVKIGGDIIVQVGAHWERTGAALCAGLLLTSACSPIPRRLPSRTAAPRASSSPCPTCAFGWRSVPPTSLTRCALGRGRRTAGLQPCAAAAAMQPCIPPPSSAHPQLRPADGTVCRTALAPTV
jgi:hypothetical protein